MHEAVDAFLASGEAFARPDVYMCGPPPMVEAAEEMLVGKHKLDEQRIFLDKFTTSADAGGEQAAAAAAGSAVKRGRAAGQAGRARAASGQAAGDDSEREFQWYTPAKRRATLYEDVTIDTPALGPPPPHARLAGQLRGRPRHLVGLLDARCSSGDWFAFRDPGEQWERPFYQAGTAVEHQIEGAMRSATEEGLIDDFAPEWVEFLRELPPGAGLLRARPVVRDRDGRPRLPVGLGRHLRLPAGGDEAALGPGDRALRDGPRGALRRVPDRVGARESFLSDEPWQPTRRYLERLAATHDWGEVIVAANLCFEPIVGTLIRRELGIRAAAANGDTVTPVLARVETQEWEWARAWTHRADALPARGSGARRPRTAR